MPKDPFDGIFTETQPQQSSSGFDGIFQGEATTLDGFQSVQRKESSILDAPFKSSPTDTGLTAGAKAIGNLPSSALRLGKGFVDIGLHPIQTAKAIGSTALGGFEKLIPGEQGNEQQFNQFTQALKQRYGSLEALQKTATEDPFGLGTDIVGLFAGGATLAGRGGQAANLASKTAKIATSPITKTAEAVGKTVSGTARFATSQATGLSPSTITEVIKNPAAFAKSATNPSRTQIAEAVGNALDSRLGELSDIGSGYQEIRKAQGVVNIPANTVSNILDKYGIKLKDGKVVTSPESRPLEAGDKAAIEKFIKDYGKETTLSPNAFLNVREALSNLGDYNRLNPNGKTNISTSVARDLRGAYDSLGGQQLPGLKELDALYAPERQLLGQLKRDILDAQGNLKDGAISKIANITGKGKEQFLERVKEVVPDIEQRIRVLKAVEDIEAASGLKVGTYARAVVGGGGIATGNIPVIIGAILSQPEVAVPLLRAYGYTGAKAAEVLRPLRTILEDVNNFRIPAPVIDYLREQQPGLSMKKVLPQGVLVPKNAIKELTATDIAKLERGLRKPTTLEERLQFELDKQSVAEKLRADKFPDDTARDRYLNDVLSEYNDQQGPSLLEGDAPSPGTVSSKQSTVTNMSTSNALTGRGDVSVPKTDMSGGFGGAKTTTAKATLAEGDRVILKNQVGKRGAVVQGFADNGNLVLVKFDNGATKVVSKQSLGRAETPTIAPDLMKAKDAALQSPVLNDSEIAKIKGATTFDEVWNIVNSKGPDTVGMFTTRLRQAFKPSPSIPKELEGLAAEARKYKTAEEFVKKNVFFRGEGGQNVAQGKPLLARGRHFALGDEEYTSGFGAVKAYILKPQAKVFDASGMNFREIGEKLGYKSSFISTEKLTQLLKENGYDVLKYDGTYTSSGKPFVHTVEITPDSFIPQTKEALTDFFNKVKGNK